MPLTVRNSGRRRRRNPDEKVPERPAESTSSAQVMAPTRMKLRVRRRDNGGAVGGGQPEEEEEEEERSQENNSRSSRRKNTNSASSTVAATSSSSPPSSSTTSASVRAVMAAEEASPDSKCPICLDRFNNLAYLDRCLHRFCFPCIQEWSHNKAECPLCKQPFTSILHSVRSEDDFKEYTLRPAPANSSVAATVAMVAAMASAARSNHQMRLMLRRHRVADTGETTTRRRRRERGGRGRGGSGVPERTGVWEWYLDSPPIALPPLLHHPAVSPVVAEDSEEGEDLEEQRVGVGADLAERGVIFEGLTGLGGVVAPLAPNDRASRRLMTRLAARQRLQREGGTVRRLRERETVAFRRTLYRCGIRVQGVAGVSNQEQQQRDITAENFRRNPANLNRLRPWLRRELTVLYGAHGSLVDIVQRIIMARLARHGLEDTPTVEEELRPFLLARTDHFLHELVSFARSPLSLENYDLQAVYEPPAAALELDGISSSSDSSSVIAISEGEEEERQLGGRTEERLLRRADAHDDLIQTGSSLSLSAWDDETPGPSYSTAEPSCSLASLSFSPAPQEPANEEGAEKPEEEEECLIVGYKKPIAERTPELVQLSSDTEEEEDKEKKEEENTAEKLPLLATATPPLSYLPIIPPSTSSAFTNEPDNKEKDDVASRRRSRARSWSGSSEKSRNSVCTLSPTAPGESEQRRENWRDRNQSVGEVAGEKRRRKRSRRGQERSKRKSGTLYNPNRSIYPAMMRHRSHSPSPFHSSIDSSSPPSPPDSSWEYRCSQISSLTSSASPTSRSSSSSHCSSPQPSTQGAPSLSPGNNLHSEKPGGKRKYKSRHLDSNDKDPTWRPSSCHRREKRRERREKERRRRRRDEGRRRERQRRGVHKDGGGDGTRCREDRSPSVEIIYEGTITSSMTQPPTRKRRRKRHCRTQCSSSPVIITLDSDSSLDDANKHGGSSSSSPLSSQQTVDFSDLPPLPLLHTADVGGALTAEIGELPIDILDRASDGSETEPAGQSMAAGPIAIDNSDNSDHNIDVENVEEGGPLLDPEDDKAPMEKAETMTDLLSKRDSEVATSDSRLLATILSDLKGITAPKCDLSLGFEPDCLLDTRKKHFRDQSEVSLDHPNQGWLPEEQVQSHDSRDQSQGFDLPIFHTSLPPLKECRVREEGKDQPPLLKQASPVRLHNRNTPPPLKHKDAGSPQLLSSSPTDAEPVRVNSHNPNSTSCAELPHQQTIPPISTLKRRFTALRGETASTGNISATDMHSPCRLAPIDSHSAAPSQVGAFAIHSTCHKPTRAFYSASEGSSAPHQDVRLHSGLDSTKEVSSAPSDNHPVNSVSPVDFHSAWSKDKSAHSTSTGCRHKTTSPDSCRGVPVDLHPSTLGGNDVFSGANCNDTSPTAFASSIDSRTPSSPTDSSSRTKEEEKLSPSRAARFFPTDPRRSTVDLHSSSSASGAIVSHCPSPPSFPSGHLNHTALSSSTLQTSHTKLSSQSEPPAESKLLRDSDPKACGPEFATNAGSKLPVDSHSKNSVRDFELPAANHMTSSPQPVENQWNSSH